MENNVNQFLISKMTESASALNTAVNDGAWHFNEEEHGRLLAFAEVANHVGQTTVITEEFDEYEGYYVILEISVGGEKLPIVMLEQQHNL